MNHSELHPQVVSQEYDPVVHTIIHCAKCGSIIGPLRVHQGSSHAERRGEVVQTVSNIAIGLGVQIVHEMQVDLYNFFLEEVIKRRNRLKVKELRRKLKARYFIRREDFYTTLSECTVQPMHRQTTALKLLCSCYFLFINKGDENVCKQGTSLIATYSHLRRQVRRTFSSNLLPVD
jgi:hypothetical protein